MANHWIVHELLALSKANSMGLVFLCETRQASTKMEKLKWILGTEGFAGVGSDRRSGRIALFWDENLQVTVLDSCARYIDVQIVDAANDKSWRSTFVYDGHRWKIGFICGITSRICGLFLRNRG